MKIRVREDGLRVVEVGSGCSAGTLSIVTGITGAFTAECASIEFSVERFEKEGEDEAGEEGAEWASLCEAFMLEEGFKRAVGVAKPTMIGVLVQQVEEGKKWAKSRLIIED